MRVGVSATCVSGRCAGRYVSYPYVRKVQVDMSATGGYVRVRICVRMVHQEGGTHTRRYAVATSA